jgi:hypothetical protein
MSIVNVVVCILCGRERWKYHHFNAQIERPVLMGINITQIETKFQ